MIFGIFHEGSGLGNQLFRYVFTRVRALDMGVEFGMQNASKFKGASFLKIDTGLPEFVDMNHYMSRFNEQKITSGNGLDVRTYDNRIREIQDSTIVDGEFQDEKYFMHRLTEVNEWLTPLPYLPVMDKDECVLAHRGGEYTLYPELYLTRKYWDDAMANMRKINPNVWFRVVTDDIFSAMEMFPNLPISHEISDDWKSIRYAPWLILSNSSFGILPALLGPAKKIIAPLHWARHNIAVWALPQNCYTRFTYQDRQGNLYE